MLTCQNVARPANARTGGLDCRVPDWDFCARLARSVDLAGAECRAGTEGVEKKNYNV